MCAGENTSQPVSVRIVRRRRTVSARNGLHPPCRKTPQGFFDSLRPAPDRALAFFSWGRNVAFPHTASCALRRRCHPLSRLRRQLSQRASSLRGDPPQRRRKKPRSELPLWGSWHGGAVTERAHGLGSPPLRRVRNGTVTRSQRRKTAWPKPCRLFVSCCYERRDPSITCP